MNESSTKTQTGFYPRVHYRVADSTNARARELAVAGAPHGTVVTADKQLAGRGRQGRSWSTPPGALAVSVLLRNPPVLLSIRAGIAVAEAVEHVADRELKIKWPNDLHSEGRKVAGILVEGRPQENWAVVGIGINAAVDLADLDQDLRWSSATLGLSQSCLAQLLEELLQALEGQLLTATDRVVEMFTQRDALCGQEIFWQQGSGVATGIDSSGHLLVETANGLVSLEAGEVHLQR